MTRRILIVTLLLFTAGCASVTAPAVAPPPLPENGWPPLILQPSIPGEVPICDWDGYRRLDCMTMEQLREFLNHRQET